MADLPTWAQQLAAPGAVGVILLLLAAIVWFERRLATAEKARSEGVQRAEDAKQALEDRVTTDLRERVVKAEQTAKDSSEGVLRINTELGAALAAAAAAQAEVRSLLRERDELRSEREVLRAEVRALTEHLRTLRRE
jgi:chromosome segregation ATPase